MQLGGGVGILTEKGFYHPLADLAAVLVVGAREHQDVLGYTASGRNIALAQIVSNQLLQIFHAAVQTALG